MEKKGKKDKALTIVGIVLCVILVPILIANVTMIIKSFTNPSKVPMLAGRAPLIVLTDSMYPKIESGDLIVIKSEEPNNIVVGDVISFFDPDGNGTSVVTHRVVEILTDGGLKFRTKGDANNTEDQTPVPAENLVGKWNGFKIHGAGNVAMFLQTTPGLIVCVAVPAVLLIGYDLLRRRKYDKAQKEDTDALLKELEELRAAKAAAAEGAAADPAAPGSAAPAAASPVQAPATAAQAAAPQEPAAPATPAAPAPEPSAPEHPAE